MIVLKLKMKKKEPMPIQKKNVMHINHLLMKKIRAKLLLKLQPRNKKPKDISRARHEIVVNNLHITEDDLIVDTDHQTDEEAKIMEWIETNLVYYGGSKAEYFDTFIFADLVYVPFKGHIYLARAGIKPHRRCLDMVI